jgi:Bacterial PH domain
MGPESNLYGVFAVCLAVLGIAWAIESEAAGQLLGLLRLGGAWALAAFLGLRMARLGVFIEHDGIRVRNPVHTLTIPWRAVRGFTLGRSMIGDFGIAELHDGRHVRLWAIQPATRVSPKRDRRAELAIGTLNVELQEARARGSLPARRDHPAGQVRHVAPAERS